tara:strand:+ start:531 stop:743 length:213 start_codon:yes stop_codon:yes gene_type:complete
MSSFQIKSRISEVQKQLRNASANGLGRQVAELEGSLWQWKRILADVELQEFEDRVGFKSMEQNAGVWNER